MSALRRFSRGAWITRAISNDYTGIRTRGDLLCAIACFWLVGCLVVAGLFPIETRNFLLSLVP